MRTKVKREHNAKTKQGKIPELIFSFFLAKVYACAFAVTNFEQQHRFLFFCFLLGIFVLCISLYPEYANAVGLENQLESINNLITKKIKTYGISGATIAGGTWALFKGNIKLTGIIVFIGIILSYYLNWINDGMNI